MSIATKQVGTAIEAPRQRGVSARAVLLGLLLTPPNVFFLVKESWLWGGMTGETSLFTNVVGGLFLGVLANLWLRRNRPRWAFSSGELLTMYLILSIGTGLTCSIWDVGGSIHIYMTHPYWFATEQNRWQIIVWPYLPSWLGISNREVLEGFHYGRTNPYVGWILRAWMGPTLWWTLLMSAIMWVGLCLNSILRRRWADHERLAFPLTVLPVQLTEERYSLFTSKLFWIGTAVAAGLSLWGTLVALVPSLPSIPTSWEFRTAIANNPPWSFLRFGSVSWAPWYLGLAYLIPLDLSFSMFVFGFFWCAQYVISAHFGWCINPWSGFPYGEQQTAGGFIALALVALWLDRTFLFQVLRRAFGLAPKLPGEEEEAFSYRTAVFGIIAGVAVLWWLLHKGGLGPWIGLIFLGHYFLMMIVMTRVRAQLGAPSHQLYGAMPSWVMPTVGGTSVLGPRTEGMFFMLRPLLQEQRNHPLPFQLEGLKMTEGGRMERRRLAVVMAIVPVVAMLCYFWATIHIGYHQGLSTGYTHPFHTLIGGWGTDELRANLENPTFTDIGGTLAILISAVVTSILYYLKLRYIWWPLHPVAYPISMSNTIATILPALFLTWLTKLILLRYGGLRAHRIALPLFLGFLVGDATIALLRELVFLSIGQRV